MTDHIEQSRRVALEGLGRRDVLVYWIREADYAGGQAYAVADVLRSRWTSDMRLARDCAAAEEDG